jgi:hypothetical protein
MAFAMFPPASLSGSGTLTAITSSQKTSSISGSAALQAIYGVGRTVSITGKGTLQSYSTSPQTPGIARTSSIIGKATLLATGEQPNACECPDYLNLFPLVCGYVVDDLCNANTTGVTEYELPFTLPVFRMHILATTISIGGGATEYDVADITNGQFDKTETLVNTSTREGSLVKTYKRMGCM